MYYELIGNNEENTMVFLHGWGADSSIFRGVISLLPKQKWRYLVIDFNGFGKSSEPEEPYGVGDYANEVVDLLKELGIKSAVFVGHSFGGRVAIKLASIYHSCVKKLVLVDSAGIILNRGLIYKFKVWKYKTKKKLIEKGFINGDLSKMGSLDYRNLKTEIMRKTFINVVNEDLLGDAKMIKAPTFIVWGAADKDTPIQMAKKFHKAIVGAKLFIIQGAGHYCFLDKTEDFVYILYDNIFI